VAIAISAIAPSDHGSPGLNSRQLEGLPEMTNRLALLLCLSSLCSACAGLAKTPPPPNPGEPSSPIYVIGQGWHAGIALRRADIPPGLVPESADFPEADYLELGWGDFDYYQADDPGLGLLLKAALWPTASVLHVVGVKGAVAGRFGGFEIVRLEVTRSRFADLAAFVHASFLRDGAAKAGPIRRGYGWDTYFYPATGKFHIFNTCNTWAARALEAAGYPMGKLLPFTVEQLMARVRRHAAAQERTARAAAPGAAVP
jgi:uncharacterized protein (TIGR02117 family)